MLRARVVEQASTDLGAWRRLANAAWRAEDHETAIEACRRVAKLAPQDPANIGPFARALMTLGLVEQSLRVIEGGLTIHPESLELLQCRCLALNYADDVSPEVMREAADRFGAALERQTPVVDLPRREPSAKGDDPMRIGYLSADFREHSVSSFLSSLLEAHDPTRVRVYMYSNNQEDDATTERLRSRAHAWCGIRSMNDDDAARLIARDDLDVLIELSGHTIGHRLGVAARRPARRVMTYLGYPNTTGLSRIDHRIVDDVTDPPGSERWMSERALRLPGCFVCYTPPEAGPACERERGGRGPITFGSFNNVAKITDRTVRLWSEIVRSVAGSVLVLKAAALAGRWTRDRLAARFAEAGLDASRVRVMPPTQSREEHLSAYSGIDVALDTFPYHGTTTTCEALWMGVPVITMMGRVHAARVGGSLLASAGLGELVADSERDYVRIAVSLARDEARLRAMKAGLRERFECSSVCDGPRFARAFESALFDACGARGDSR